MSDTPFTNEKLLQDAVERARRQFPEVPPEKVLEMLEKQYRAANRRTSGESAQVFLFQGLKP